MASRRADLHTLAGPYALNALPPGDRARFERHLAACDAVRAGGARAPGDRGPDGRGGGRAAPGPAAGPGARRGRADQAAAPGPGRPGGGGDPLAVACPPRGRGAPRPAERPAAVAAPGRLALSAAFAAAAVAFGFVALDTQHSLSQAQARDHMLAAVLTAPDAKMMSAPVTGGGTATVVMSHREHALAFSSAGLPSLPAGQGYELWLMGPSGGRPAAMLPRPAHGMTSPVIATGIRAGDMVELTVEPAGGAPRPTTAPILRLSL